jgi:hypothetical protein
MLNICQIYYTKISAAIKSINFSPTSEAFGGRNQKSFPHRNVLLWEKKRQINVFLSITGALATFSLQNPWFCGENIYPR